MSVYLSVWYSQAWCQNG